MEKWHTSLTYRPRDLKRVGNRREGQLLAHAPRTIMPKSDTIDINDQITINSSIQATDGFRSAIVRRDVVSEVCSSAVAVDLISP